MSDNISTETYSNLLLTAADPAFMAAFTSSSNIHNQPIDAAGAFAYVDEGVEEYNDDHWASDADDNSDDESTAKDEVTLTHPTDLTEPLPNTSNIDPFDFLTQRRFIKAAQNKLDHAEVLCRQLRSKYDQAAEDLADLATDFDAISLEYRDAAHLLHDLSEERRTAEHYKNIHKHFIQDGERVLDSRILQYRLALRHARRARRERREAAKILRERAAIERWLEEWREFHRIEDLYYGINE